MIFTITIVLAIYIVRYLVSKRNNFYEDFLEKRKESYRKDKKEWWE